MKVKKYEFLHFQSSTSIFSFLKVKKYEFLHFQSSTSIFSFLKVKKYEFLHFYFFRKSKLTRQIYNENT
ncbi:hypothetical protein LEP1GSC044_2181 [Leptospira kirschneri serovar Grippotyphosa str. RM52]|nr:hypothetical protein LEP1GSC044_2181 [Leptospira kirschneri serovar Grippotyphosa str. RM52]OOV50339.1 hypothetical protein B1J94_01525 [Leptospira kirschneri serovar Grippotyphosa]